jgi:hypothetical protein
MLTGSVDNGDAPIKLLEEFSWLTVTMSHGTADAEMPRGPTRGWHSSSGAWMDLVEDGCETIAFDLEVIAALEVHPEALGGAEVRAVALAECGVAGPRSSLDQMARASSAKVAWNRCLGSISMPSS